MNALGRGAAHGNAAAPVPRGLSVRLAAGLLTGDDGRLLVGGSPLTAMRLTSRAQHMLTHGAFTVTDAATAHLADRLLATNIGVPDLRQTAPVPVHEITVVVPVRDRPDQLDRTLAALHPLRLVVVDDASIEPGPVAEVARRHHAQLIQLLVNAGPAAARNAGLATVTTPYVAFVDSDVTVNAHDLTALARHFIDPSVVLVGPRIQGVVRSPHPRWFERYDAFASSLTLGATPCSVRPGGAVAWLPSACLVAVVSALGPGFDPTLRVGEDVDLVWRLIEQGHRVRYDPTIRADHDTRPTIRSWLGRKFVYGTGGAALAARHGTKLAPAVLTPAYAAAAAAVLLRSPFAALAVIAALLSGARSIRKALPETSRRDAIATRLAARGLIWALRQESALLLRHWWPATAVGVVALRPMRTALLTALLVDGLAALWEQDEDDRLSLAATMAGRRLDDLAYGAGLWWGALNARSAMVLRPRRPTNLR